MSNSPSLDTFRLLHVGDTALTVEFGNSIDPIVNERAIAFAERIRRANWKGVLDIVPTYRSVTIHVDSMLLNIMTLSKKLKRLAARTQHPSRVSRRRHCIPVLYGEPWGPDLAHVASSAKLSVAEAIQLHSLVTYRVYMLGFTPGFPYMGIVPGPLALPRLATPRLSVPAGSVAIADNQTGIYPATSPGGWRLIGRTPVALYCPDHRDPFLFSPGDSVKFEPITEEQFEDILSQRHDDAN